MFEGPKMYKSVDGTFHEEVTLTFEKEHVSGVPLNKLNVLYGRRLASCRSRRSFATPREAHPQGMGILKITTTPASEPSLSPAVKSEVRLVSIREKRVVQFPSCPCQLVLNTSAAAISSLSPFGVLMGL